MTVKHKGVVQPGTSIMFDKEEEEANAHLLAVMHQIQEWDLNCNKQELVDHVHGLQLFLIKHMLQRYDARGWGGWYGKEESK